MIEATVPGATITFADGAGPDKRSYRVSFAKVARRLPGFEPRWTVQRGHRGAAARPTWPTA